MATLRIPITTLAGAIPLLDGSGYRFVVQFLDGSDNLISNPNLTQNQSFIRTSVAPPFFLDAAIADGNYSLSNVKVRIHSDTTGSGKYKDKLVNISVNCGYSMSIYNVSHTVELKNPQQAAPDCFFAVNILEPIGFRGPKDFVFRIYRGGVLLHTEPIANLDTAAFPAIIFDPKNPVWNFDGPDTYTLQLTTVVNGTTYQDSTQIQLIQADFDCGTGGGGGEGGNTGIIIEDYAVSGSTGKKVDLNLSGGFDSEDTTIVLKVGNSTVGTLTGDYAGTMSVDSSVYGHVDVYINGIDKGTVYIPQRLFGSFVVEQGKAVDENNNFMELTFTQNSDGTFTINDIGTAGFTTKYYNINGKWRNSGSLGIKLEPNITHSITKYGYNGTYWGDNSAAQNKKQITFRIVPA